ncbi:MAG: GGDEF domain-containing protein [Acidobacteria bacterium]|jgi:diguanylate cyclase (GGDEF)-like protein|nr:GGDEF domain-containing protein [Acidobacteriota bacterium]
MNSKLRDMLSTANYFALVCLSALSISFIVSIVVYNLGVPVRAADYVRINLFVTACIAIPTAVIASLHDFHTRIYQRRLEALAWTDELTGLLNRRFFLKAAEEECHRMRRTRQTAAVAVLDLDFFKEVNDLYGHAAGDRVLKSIAQIAHAELRGPFDKLGRWGGEEFVVLLSDVTPETAQIVCDRLRSRIQASLIETGEFRVCVTASFGYCMLGAGAEVNSAIEAADRALYEAKRLGRNRVEHAEYVHAEVQDIAEFKKRSVAHKRRVAANDDLADELRSAAIEQVPRLRAHARLRKAR